MIQAGASITSVNLAEVVDRMARIYAVDVALDVEALSTLHLEVAVATADPALAQAMVAEGGEVVALPDSQGRRPGE